jgi:hypothetical protein
MVDKFFFSESYKKDQIEKKKYKIRNRKPKSNNGMILNPVFQ